MNDASQKSRDAYQSALDFLYDRINYEKTSDQPYNRQNFRLSRMERLLVELGNPQQFAPVIHIAGSKGKGSVAWLIAETLRRSGYKTGLYTSPHLIHLEERFVVNGAAISSEELVQAVEAIGPAAHRIAKEGHGNATFFELTTAIAWWIFRQKQVDVNVIEVGLGGRLDSTNVCWPALSIITSISYDHQQQLGETLAEIAFEKAGIIKPGVPVISGVTHPEASTVIRRIAKERGCMLKELDVDFRIAIQDPTVLKDASTLGGTRFDYMPCSNWTNSKARSGLVLRMLGDHQANNASLVLAAVDTLLEQRWKIKEEAVRDSLLKTAVSGRVEMVSQKPFIIVDTSHNEASISALVATIKQPMTASPRVAIFSASRDKNFKQLLRLILPCFDQVILTQYQSNPRATPLELLKSAIEELRLQEVAEGVNASGSLAETVFIANPSDAFRCAMEKVGQDGMLCVMGSFFLAAEVLPLLKQSDL